MRHYKVSIWLSIIPVIFVNGFKKNNWIENDPVKVSIADVRVVRSDKGQKPVDVMVCLSQPASKPVKVEYITKNGSALAGTDYVTSKGTITFAPGETMKRIRVLIIGEVAADADEDAPAVPEISFGILLTSIENAMILHGTAIITLIQNVFTPQVNQSVYDVRLVYEGYTSLGGKIEHCPIRSNGTVVLEGRLVGYENVGSTDDIEYTGTLQLDIDMDICSAKTEEDPGGGYPICAMTVNGSGVVNTELKIHFDGRGGYITTENKSGRFTKSVNGSCDQGQIGEELNMVPNETIASVFNGLELPMLTHRTLQTRQYQHRIDDRNVVFVDVRKIR